jgi:ABC-2 type transport system permease protein
MNPVAPDPTRSRGPEPILSVGSSAFAGQDAPRLSPAAALGDPRGSVADSPVPLSRRVPLSAVGALFLISADRQIRGRKLFVLCLLLALPILLALLARHFEDPYHAAQTEDILVLGILPQALLPLVALIYAAGMVQDDVEEQTLTYLLIRPIPRWMIYLIKLAGTWLVLSLLTSLFTAVSLAVVYWDTGEQLGSGLIQRAAILSGILSLGLLAYTAIFGAIGLLVRRALVVGVAYIVVLEGVAANIDFVFRHLTVMYYVRTLCIHWLGLSGADWAIDPSAAPSAMTCVLTLLGIGAVPALFGAWFFSVWEFRVKTPEGS